MPARRPATLNVSMFASHNPPLCTAKLLSYLEINIGRDGCSRAACSSNSGSRQTEYAIRVTSPILIQQLLQLLKLYRMTACSGAEQAAEDILPCSQNVSHWITLIKSNDSFSNAYFTSFHSASTPIFNQGRD